MLCARCSNEIDSESAFCRHCGASVVPSSPPRRLARVPAEGQLAGVCAGIANYLEADVTLVRLTWILLSLVPGTLIGGLIVYVVAAVVMPVQAATTPRSDVTKRLGRTHTDRYIAGVCGGIAAYFGLDSTLLRVVTIILAIYPGVIIGGVVVYLVAWLIMPPESAEPLPPAVSR